MRAPILLGFMAIACAAPSGPTGHDAYEAASQAVRPDSPSEELFRFDPGDQVESVDSAQGHFKLHFTRAGRHAVPAADADGDGTPDFVEHAGETYEEVLAFYVQLGFRAPLSDAQLPANLNGGDGKFDVYFVDFARAADGAFRTDACLPDAPRRCIGYMVQENDFAGYSYPSTEIANRVLASHELFHAVQAAYDSGQGSVLSEGTAVWATEAFDPTLNDFEGFLDGYFSNPDRTLNVPLPGPVDPFSYGSAIFFRFLSERFGDAVLVELWSACEQGAGGIAKPDWFDVIDRVLRAHGSSFDEAFRDFATRNLFTGAFADPARGYANGAHYPAMEMRDVQPSFAEKLRVFNASTQYVRLRPGTRSQLTAALVATEAGDDALAGLALVIAPQTRTKYLEIKTIGDVTQGFTIDTAGVDKLVVAVVNTNRIGNSKKPALCIGTPDEVAQCREQLGVKVEQPPVQEPPKDESGCSALSVDALAIAGLAMLRRSRAAAQRERHE